MQMRKKPHFKSGLVDWIKKVEEKLERKPSVGIEIGTYKAEGALILSQYCDHLICVDPYVPYEDIAAKGIQKIKHKMLDNIKKVNNISFMHMNSYKAWDLLGSTKFDFVYIDGDHNYRPVKHDIIMWSNSSVVLGGHDYTDESFPGVKEAVDELAKVYSKQVITFDDTSWMYE